MTDNERKLLPPAHPTLGTSMGPTWKTLTAGIVVFSLGIFGYYLNAGIGDWVDWLMVWGFLLMGGLFSLAGYAGMSDRSRRRSLKLGFVGEPWRYDRRWEEKGVRQGLEFLKFDVFPYFVGGSGSVEYQPGGGKEVEGLKMILRCVEEEWAKGRPKKGEVPAKCFELYYEELNLEETEQGFKVQFNIPSDGKADKFCCEPVTYWEIECRDKDDYAYFFPIPVYNKDNPDAEGIYKL